MNENLFGENSYIKFGSPEHVRLKIFLILEKNYLKIMIFQILTKSGLNICENDVSFSTKSLEGKVNSMIKKIERSTIELADKLAKLEKSLFETAWDSVVINNKINNGEFVYWVFEQDNQIVGYLAIQKTFFDIHILGIGVLESHRNNSIAKNLHRN